MLPFKVDITSGDSAYRQVVYAAKKAWVAGRLRPGDPFPSVRVLSQELGINPNTAHKVVAALVADGLLEVRPGIGTAVAEPSPADRRRRGELLGPELERLTVEAKRLGLGLDDVADALAEHWRLLSDES